MRQDSRGGDRTEKKKLHSKQEMTSAPDQPQRVKRGGEKQSKRIQKQKKNNLNSRKGK